MNHWTVYPPPRRGAFEHEGPAQPAVHRAERRIDHVELAESPGYDRCAEGQVGLAGLRDADTQAAALSVTHSGHDRHSPGQARGASSRRRHVRQDGSRRESVWQLVRSQAMLSRRVCAQALRVMSNRPVGSAQPQPVRKWPLSRPTRKAATSRYLTAREKISGSCRRSQAIFAIVQVGRQGLAGHTMEAVLAPRLLQGRQERPGAFVHPENAGAKGRAAFTHGHERLPLRGDAQGGQSTGVDGPSRLPQRLTGGLPPGLGRLLVPARARCHHRQRATPLALDAALRVPHHRLAGRRAAVEADDQVTLQGRLPVAIHSVRCWDILHTQVGGPRCPPHLLPS